MSPAKPGLPIHCYVSFSDRNTLCGVDWDEYPLGLELLTGSWQRHLLRFPDQGVESGVLCRRCFDLYPDAAVRLQKEKIRTRDDLNRMMDRSNQGTK